MQRRKNKEYVRERERERERECLRVGKRFKDHERVNVCCVYEIERVCEDEIDGESVLAMQ